MTRQQRVDVLVVGAGVVGLTCAAAAVDRGLSVAVVDRDERCVGASVRNFGHVSITAQSGTALELGLIGRGRWLELARAAGFWLAECGTVVLARNDDEAAVLQELAELRGSDQVRLVDRRRIGDHLPSYDPAAVLAAFLPLDLRVDPREAIPVMASWLERRGVRFHWRTAVGAVDDGVVTTSRGPMVAGRVIVCVGHDLDRLAPAVADEYDVQRCTLQMLEVAPPAGGDLDPALLSGLSMLRYPALRACPSAALVEQRLKASTPEALDHVLNLMVTRRPDGSLVLGDSHRYARTPAPFEEERVAELLLDQGARLLGVDRLHVRRRWRGVYASSSRTDLLVHDVAPGTRLVSITSGLGMTVAPGLAERLLDVPGTVGSPVGPPP